MASLTFYLFPPTRLINLIKHEHSFKILYVKFNDNIYVSHNMTVTVLNSNPCYRGTIRDNVFLQ